MRRFRKMSKCLLTYFMLSLIVLQTTFVMDDTYQLYQSGLEYLSFDDFQKSSDELKQHIELAELLEEQERDGCHCHGHCYTAILTKSSSFIVQKARTVLSSYSEYTSTNILNPLLRPPIAHA